MNFQEIKDGSRVFPGEYILHKPTQQIVLCGAFKPQAGTIKAMANGRLLEDKIENFQKIQMTRSEKDRQNPRRSCGGCKSR